MASLEPAGACDAGRDAHPSTWPRVVPSVVTPEWCSQVVRWARSNARPSTAGMHWADASTCPLLRDLCPALSPHVPERCLVGEAALAARYRCHFPRWSDARACPQDAPLAGLHERLWVVVSAEGSGGSPMHCDTPAESLGARSELSAVLYLNDDVEGGATVVATRPSVHIAPDPEQSEGGDAIATQTAALGGDGGDNEGPLHFETVRPVTGALCLFPHTHLHRGEAVAAGTKFILRSNVMYKQPPPALRSLSAHDEARRITLLAALSRPEHSALATWYRHPLFERELLRQVFREQADSPLMPEQLRACGNDSAARAALLRRALDAGAPLGGRNPTEMLLELIRCCGAGAEETLLLVFRALRETARFHGHDAALLLGETLMRECRSASPRLRAAAIATAFMVFPLAEQDLPLSMFRVVQRDADASVRTTALSHALDWLRRRSRRGLEPLPWMSEEVQDRLRDESEDVRELAKQIVRFCRVAC
jgi:hypothetical protein